MYARVVRWEGADADAMRRSAEDINARSESGPPEGLPPSSFRLLVDYEAGRALGIAFFDSEEDLRKGHEVLESMSPPGDGFGRRVSVEMYEVPVDVGS
jgi:hypothetical protein